MLTSELITLLQSYLQSVGDLPITFADGTDIVDVFPVGDMHGPRAIVITDEEDEDEEEGECIV